MTSTRTRSLRTALLRTALMVLGVVVAQMTHGVARGEPDPVAPDPDPPPVLPYPATDPIVASEGAGNLSGSSSVTPTGQYTYRLPIDVPPGRAGMQPSLALSYTSGAGNGLLGVGWSLEGLSEIRRCHKTWATEGTADGVDFDDTDAFCLDGQKLRQINAGQKLNGHEGAEYRTERDTFARITAHGDSGQGPDRFTVEAKSGLVMEYSQRVEPHRLQGSFPNAETTDLGTVRAVWLLREVHDRSGNAMLYEWELLPNPDTLGIEYRIGVIRYTGKHVDGQDPTGDKRRVEFHYDRRDAGDESFRYESGVRWETNYALDKITLFAPDPAITGELGNYRLAYTRSPDTGRTRLSAVQRCDADDVCLRAKKFDWWERSPAGGPPHFQDVPVTIENEASDAFPDPVLVADFNGDGLDDILYRVASMGNGSYQLLDAYLHLADRAADGTVSFGNGILVNAVGKDLSCVSFRRSRAADIDGDGRAEIVAGLDPAADPTNPLCAVPGYQIFRWNDDEGAFLPVGELIDADPITDVIQLTDYDGDGLIDIFLERPDLSQGSGAADLGPWLLLRNVSGPNTPFQFAEPDASTVLATQAQFARAMDIDGDGRGDLLPIDPETTADGTEDSGFIPGATLKLGFDDDGAPAKDERWRLRSFARMQLADLNGDGLRDALYPFGPDTMIRWNLGNGFGPLMPWASPILPVASADLTPDLGLRAADLDGDGIEDLISFNNGDDPPMEPKTRVFRVRSGQWEQAELNVDGSLPKRAVDEEGRAPGDGWPYCATGDFNGDGLVDLVRAHVRRLGGDDPLIAFKLWVSIQQQAPSDVLSEVSDEDATTPQQTISYARTTPDASASCTWPQLCVRRGLPVVMQTASSAGGELAAARYKHYSYRDARVDVQGRGFLGFGQTSVYDPQLRTQTTTTFDNVTRVALPTGGSLYPYAGLPSVRRHIAAIFETPTDGSESPPLPDGALAGRVTTTTYHYNENTPNDPDALWSNADAGTYVVHGMATTTIETEGPVAVHDSEDTIELAGPPGPDYRQIDTATAYDEYENPTAVFTMTDSGTYRWIATTYENRVPEWLLGLPVHSETGAGDASNLPVIRDMDYHFDDLGRLAWTNLEPNGGGALRRGTIFFRDASGLPTEIDVQTNQSTRKTFFAYDNMEGMFPTASWNQLGHAHRAVFHPGFGVPVVSEDPNGVQVHSTYDRFGRVRGVTPDGGTAASLSYASNDCKTSAAEKGMCTSVTFVGGGEQVAYTDEYGRTWETGDLGFDGTMVFRRQRYNLFGQPVQATRPFTDFEQGVAITTFDSLGRPGQIKAPDTTTTTISYLGMFAATSTDPNQRSVTVHHDKDGRIVEVYDVAATPTRYSYGPFDQITSVEDPQGNVTQLGYDDLGRRTLLVDPDRGTTTFEHNAFGELRFVHHHVGDEASGTDLDTEYRHDILGRLVRRLDTVASNPQTTEITDYEYDQGPHALGKLSHTWSPDGIETAHYYNPQGRPWFDEWKVDGDWYGFIRTYDAATGRPATLTYPNSGESFKIGFDYNNAGWLHAVYRPSSPVVASLWTIQSRNLDGMLTSASWTSAAVAETRNYSPLSGRLHQITVNGSTSLVNLTYGYDLGGNVTSRVDGIADRVEGFQYDDADRLAQWTLQYPTAGSGHENRTTDYFYDDLGNLTALFKDGILDEVHDIDPLRPHTLASVHLLSQSLVELHPHDALGREESTQEQIAIPDPPQAVETRTVQYTPFDLPRQVSRLGDAPAEVELAYDAFGTRVKKTTSSDGVLATTITLGGLYERRERSGANGTTVQHVFYVHGDDGPIAQVVYDEAKGDETTTYLAKDGLGSVSVAFNENGVERFFHEPFGRRVDVDGEPLKSFQSTAQVSIGFTGQTQDDDLDLIDMRGRVYDPVQKRFLTPDPLVSNPLHSQSYNRYAYVLNNPLRYTDPSGFDPQAINVLTTHIGEVAAKAWQRAAGGSPGGPAAPTRPPTPSQDKQPAAGSSDGQGAAPSEPGSGAIPTPDDSGEDDTGGPNVGGIDQNDPPDEPDAPAPPGPPFPVHARDFFSGVLDSLAHSAFRTEAVVHDPGKIAARPEKPSAIRAVGEVWGGAVAVGVGVGLTVLGGALAVVVTGPAIKGGAEGAAAGAAGLEGALSTSAAKVVLNPAETQVYRGGSSMTARPIDVSTTPSGMVKPTRGVSLSTDAAGLQRFGGVRQIKSVPDGLQIVRHGKPGHYELVPTREMPMSEYQNLLNKVEFH